jgi:bla regulator protein blaR1
MNTLSTTTALLSHSMAWALLYSLWQGLLIYGSLFVLLKVLPNINSRVKYLLGMSAFTGLFIWFTDTWISQYEKLKGAVVHIIDPGTRINTVTAPAITTVAVSPEQGPLWHHILPGLEQYFPVIMLLYTLGLAFMIARFMINVWQVRALRTQGTYTAGKEWDSFIAERQRTFGIGRQVKLLLSARVNVPMMMGVLKPIILLPVATINNLTTEQVEAILLHELAHIRRHDYLLNMLQTIGETILFFNPFVWLISSIIRKEREHCCDDMVVTNTGSPLPYAKALAILETNRLQDNNLALAATGNKNQLFHRIKRIMEMKKNKLNYSQLTIILVAFIAITFMVAMFTFTPSFGQKAKKTPPADTTKKSVYHYKTVTVDGDGNRTEEDKVSDKPINDEDGVTTSSNGKKSKVVTKVYRNTDGDEDETVDADKIANEVTIAMSDISKEVAEAMAGVQKKMKEIDWDKIFNEINKGIANVNKELNDPKVRKQVRKELQGSKEAMEEAKQQIKEQMETLKEELAKEKSNNTHSYSHSYSYGHSSAPMPSMPPMPPMAASAPMPPIPPMPPMPNYVSSKYDYESMLKKMERDGLIDRSESYSVKKEKGELYINGERQPESVYNKYRPYLKSRLVSIKGHNDNLKITVKD